MSSIRRNKYVLTSIFTFEQLDILKSKYKTVIQVNYNTGVNILPWNWKLFPEGIIVAQKLFPDLLPHIS